MAERATRPRPVVYARRIMSGPIGPAHHQLAIVCTHPDCATDGEPERIITVVSDHMNYGGSGAIIMHKATHGIET
jgi:hypothetical protein